MINADRTIYYQLTGEQVITCFCGKSMRSKSVGTEGEFYDCSCGRTALYKCNNTLVKQDVVEKVKENIPSFGKKRSLYLKRKFKNY